MRVVIWALLGGVLATALDALHVLTGTLWYANPVLGLQDWWVPPQFALAGVVIGEGHRRIAIPVSRREIPAASPVELIVGVSLFIGVYASSGVFRVWPNLQLLAFIALFVVGVLVMHPSARPALYVHAAGCAIGGPLVEASISGTGLFSYANPDTFIGVPRWLPGIYLHVALASHVVDRWMLSRLSRNRSAHSRV